MPRRSTLRPYPPGAPGRIPIGTVIVSLRITHLGGLRIEAVGEQVADAAEMLEQHAA